MSVSHAPQLRRKKAWTCSWAGPCAAALSGPPRPGSCSGGRGPSPASPELPKFVWLYPLGEIRRQVCWRERARWPRHDPRSRRRHVHDAIRGGRGRGWHGLPSRSCYATRRIWTGNTAAAGPHRLRPSDSANRARRHIGCPDHRPQVDATLPHPGGLITKTGSRMAYGPTVAREYGIPAIPDGRSSRTAPAG